jgi:hypothetical protein
VDSELSLFGPEGRQGRNPRSGVVVSVKKKNFTVSVADVQDGSDRAASDATAGDRPNHVEGF